MKRCRVELVCAILVGCAATCVSIRLIGTRDMSVDEAMELIGRDLTEQQRKLVAAALRRQSLAAVRQLLAMAKIDDAAGIEARAAILQLREALK